MVSIGLGILILSESWGVVKNEKTKNQFINGDKQKQQIKQIDCRCFSPPQALMGQWVTSTIEGQDAGDLNIRSEGAEINRLSLPLSGSDRSGSFALWWDGKQRPLPHG